QITPIKSPPAENAPLEKTPVAESSFCFASSEMTSNIKKREPSFRKRSNRKTSSKKAIPTVALSPPKTSGKGDSLEIIINKNTSSEKTVTKNPGRDFHAKYRSCNDLMDHKANFAHTYTGPSSGAASLLQGFEIT